MTYSHPKVLISCGEASGEIYASDVARHLHHLRPEWELVGVGGELLATEVSALWASLEELSVMGFGEVIRHLPRLRRLRQRLVRRAAEEGVDLFLAVDYPGFHLTLASELHRLGIATLDYIPPKTWSWGAWRNRSLRRNVNRCAVIFPFEEEYYRQRGIEAKFVGHPLLDRHRETLAAAEHPRQGLLLAPGSRPQELKRIGPVMARAAALLRDTGQVESVKVSRAPTVDKELLRSSLEGVGEVEIVEGPLMGHLLRSKAAIVCSGTASVETALSRTLHLIVYRTSWFTYLVGRSLATVDAIGMANIVLGRTAFPEFVQGDLQEEKLARAMEALLATGSKEAMKQREAFDELARKLGSGRRAAENVASMAVEMLDGGL